MPPNGYFTIAATPPTQAKLKPGESASFAFTVESLAAPDQIDEVLLLAQVGGDKDNKKEAPWATVEPSTKQFPGGHSQTVTVKVTAPSDVAPGPVRVRLVVAKARDTSELFVESQPLDVEFLPASVANPDPKPFPWWIVAVASAGLLLGGGVLLYFLLRDTALAFGADCNPADSQCDQGLVCVGIQDRTQCLWAGNQSCQEDAMCASGECSKTNGLCALAVLDPCDPLENGCRSDASCDGEKKVCLVNAGAPCTTNDECATDLCESGVCKTKAPPVSIGDPCTAAGTCPDPLICDADKKTCLGKEGYVGCTAHSQCLTKYCSGNTCTALEDFRNCTADGLCSPNQRCVVFAEGKSCFNSPGRPCSGDGQCSSGYCAGGICSPDNGACTRPSDCKPPFICVTAKKKCLLPNYAMTCTSDALCLSGYCAPNQRCEPSPCGQCGPKQVCNRNTKKCVAMVATEVFLDRRFFDPAIMKTLRVVPPAPKR